MNENHICESYENILIINILTKLISNEKCEYHFFYLKSEEPAK